MAARTTFAIMILTALINATPAQPSFTPEEAAVIDWAEGQFATMGLELPDVAVVPLDNLTVCAGRVGFYHPGRMLIEMCRVDREDVLHELAHAWADHNLGDSDRAAFAEFRGVETWNGQDVAWEQRATEHAAETLVWALLERDTTVPWVEAGVASRRLLTIPDSSPEALSAAYEVLTGRPLPEGHFSESVVVAGVAEYLPGR